MALCIPNICTAHLLGKEYVEFNDDVHFFRFQQKISFLGKFGPKNQNFQFKLKCSTKNSSNMQNSTVVFTFSILAKEYLFCANLVRKIKIVSLSWNLVARLIRIRRIQWWCSLFPLSTRNTFLGLFGTKIQNCQFKLKFGT